MTHEQMQFPLIAMHDRPFEQLPFPWGQRFAFCLGLRMVQIPLAMPNTPRMPEGSPLKPRPAQRQLFDDGPWPGYFHSIL